MLKLSGFNLISEKLMSPYDILRVEGSLSPLTAAVISLIQSSRYPALPLTQMIP